MRRNARTLTAVRVCGEISSPWRSCWLTLRPPPKRTPSPVRGGSRGILHGDERAGTDVALRGALLENLRDSISFPRLVRHGLNDGARFASSWGTRCVKQPPMGRWRMGWQSAAGSRRMPKLSQTFWPSVVERSRRTSGERTAGRSIKKP
jgi:hypothetical protein